MESWIFVVFLCSLFPKATILDFYFTFYFPLGEVWSWVTLNAVQSFCFGHIIKYLNRLVLALA